MRQVGDMQWSAAFVLAALLALTGTAKGADAKSFVDESFVREVEAGGFIKALYCR